jgi:hypothetical protein
MAFAFFFNKPLKLRNLILACSVLAYTTLSGCAAGVVARRPPDVVYVRSASPGPGYVWVSGDWVWSGGKYRWREGYWHAAKPGRNWKSGYWEKDPNGYKWQKGRWQ